jgi:hypothetical protein
MQRLTTLKSFVSLVLLTLCLGPAYAQKAQSLNRPDLTIPWIAGYNYTTTTLIFNRPLTMHWSESIIFVRNIGTATSAPCHLLLQVRNWATHNVLSTYTVAVPSIAPGVTQEVDFIEPVTTANFTDPTTYMFGIVDCNSEVLESNENNNTGYSGMGGQGG